MEPKATNGAFLKKLNKRRILGSVRQNPCSRADLARQTALTRGTISLLTEELISEGLLLETDKLYPESGRPPIILEVNAKQHYTVGVSIARDKTKVGMTDFRGTVLYAKEVSAASTGQASMELIAAAIEEMLIEKKVNRSKLLGIGISAPGPLCVTEGRFLKPPNLERWHHIAICKHLETLTGLPTYLENNANTFAVAEMQYGCGETFDSMMVMTVDTGIGAGIILNRQLFRGAGGFGSEVGHVCLDIHGAKCACGNQGCLELYVARKAILKKAAEISEELKSWKDIVDHAIEGDTDCIGLIDYMAEYLAVGIVNTMNLFDFDAVVLNGDVIYKPDLLLSNLRQKVNTRAIARNFHKISLLTSKLEGDVEILCSGLVVLEKYFNGDLEGIKRIQDQGKPSDAM